MYSLQQAGAQLRLVRQWRLHSTQRLEYKINHIPKCLLKATSHPICVSGFRAQILSFLVMGHLQATSCLLLLSDHLVHPRTICHLMNRTDLRELGCAQLYRALPIIIIILLLSSSSSFLAEPYTMDLTQTHGKNRNSLFFFSNDWSGRVSMSKYSQDFPCWPFNIARCVCVCVCILTFR